MDTEVSAGRNVDKRWKFCQQSTSMEHIKENLNVFDFMLTDDEKVQIREMDKGVGTHDPENMENAVRLSAFKIHD